MSSIMTNSAAMTALQSLQNTNRNLDVTQNRISTGFKVAEASDNAAYWSIATTMRSDNKALSTVQDALGLGASKIDTAYTGMKEAIKTVDEIKSKLVAAREPGVDKEKVQTEISALQEHLKTVIGGSSISGQNWLMNDSTDPVEVVGSFTRDSDNNVKVDTIKIDISKSLLATNTGAEDVADISGGILGSEGDASGASVLGFSISDATTNEEMDQFITDIDAALGLMATGAATLGAAKMRVDLQKGFVSALQDSMDRGIGALVDADMSKESTRLQALQVQQQLGIQALSIANGNSQSILSLFR